MRSESKTASLNELMGSSGKLSLSNLHEALGEKMPEIPLNRIGRIRLVNALQERYGVNYKNLPGVKDVIAEFDKNAAVEMAISKNQEAKRGV
jgi:hypothetical protein